MGSANAHAFAIIRRSAGAYQRITNRPRWNKGPRLLARLVRMGHPERKADTSDAADCRRAVVRHCRLARSEVARLVAKMGTSAGSCEGSCERSTAQIAWIRLLPGVPSLPSKWPAGGHLRRWRIASP